MALQDLLLNFFHTTLGDKKIPIETIQQYGLLEMGNAFRALFSKKDSHYHEVDFPVECLDYIKARLHKNDGWRSDLIMELHLKASTYMIFLVTSIMIAHI